MSPDQIQTSSRLYQPVQGKLSPLRDDRAESTFSVPSLRSVEQDIKSLFQQRNYPCVAALQSYHQDDYQVGFYGRLGGHQFWRELRKDLIYFLREQKKSHSVHLSFWAVFEPEDLSEDEFEMRMWTELSYLTSAEDRDKDWKPGSVSDPTNPSFRFSLEGTELFVVGLHSNSSRLARVFNRPALIFNSFDQFETLQRQGQYDSMVAMNRKRDRKFQGSVNPMTEKHGETWESIQFSGKNNPDQWTCPFSFLMKAFKK